VQPRVHGAPCPWRCCSRRSLSRGVLTHDALSPWLLLQLGAASSLLPWPDNRLPGPCQCAHLFQATVAQILLISRSTTTLLFDLSPFLLEQPRILRLLQRPATSLMRPLRFLLESAARVLGFLLALLTLFLGSEDRLSPLARSACRRRVFELRTGEGIDRLARETRARRKMAPRRTPPVAVDA
jgi:hypothetical protein